MILPEVNAEQVLDAVEGVYIRSSVNVPCTAPQIAGFMSVSTERAQEALRAGVMLGYLEVSEDATEPRYLPAGTLARCVAEVDMMARRAFFRLQLEEFGPYKLYKMRRLSGTDSTSAARQVCNVFEIESPPPGIVASTLNDWGSWAGSLGPNERGELVPIHDAEMLQKLAERLMQIENEHAAVVAFVQEEIGEEALAFIRGQCLDDLITGVTMLRSGARPNSIVWQLGNAYETFLRLIGERPPSIDLTGADGIGQIGKTLRGQGRIAKRHLGSVDFVNQVRIAADHGGDKDEGNRAWGISPRVAEEAIMVALASIRSICKYQSGFLEL